MTLLHPKEQALTFKEAHTLQHDLNLTEDIDDLWALPQGISLTWKAETLGIRALGL